MEKELEYAILHFENGALNKLDNWEYCDYSTSNLREKVRNGFIKLYDGIYRSYKGYKYKALYFKTYEEYQEWYERFGHSYILEY